MATQDSANASSPSVFLRNILAMENGLCGHVAR